MRFSVRPGSPETTSRTRSASSTSYAMAASISAVPANVEPDGIERVGQRYLGLTNERSHR